MSNYLWLNVKDSQALHISDKECRTDNYDVIFDTSDIASIDNKIIGEMTFLFKIHERYLGFKIEYINYILTDDDKIYEIIKILMPKMRINYVPDGNWQKAKNKIESDDWGKPFDLPDIPSSNIGKEFEKKECDCHKNCDKQFDLLERIARLVGVPPSYVIKKEDE